MSTVKAYYDGITFFPIETLNIPGGKVVNLTIDEAISGLSYCDWKPFFWAAFVMMD